MPNWGATHSRNPAKRGGQIRASGRGGSGWDSVPPTDEIDARRRARGGRNLAGAARVLVFIQGGPDDHEFFGHQGARAASRALGSLGDARAARLARSPRPPRPPPHAGDERPEDDGVAVAEEEARDDAPVTPAPRRARPPSTVARRFREAAPVSQYRGLRKQNSGKWQVQMSIDGKQQSFGTFEIELEAAQAFDAKCREVGKHHLMNFPDVGAPAPKPRTQTSEYRGVKKKRKKWSATIEKTYIGTFEDELSAARAFDARARELGLDDYCNFSDDEGPPPQRNRREPAAQTSEYRGVSNNNGSWTAKFGKHYAGTYKDELTAARAYDAKCRELGKHGACNFPDESS